MRVLFATNHSYLPQRAGGSESCTHELCVEFLALGHEVAVLASIEVRGLLGARNRFHRKVVRRYRFPEDRVMGYPVYRGWLPVRGVDEVLRRFRPDVVVVQAGRPLELAAAFSERGTPCVVYLHDVLFDDLGGTPRAGGNPLYVANSAFTARRAREVFGIRAQIVPPLVRRERYETPTSRRHALLVNPDPMKGGGIALDLAEARPDIPFVFVECWPDNRLLREYRRRAAAARNVRWRGRVGDMRRVYRTTKLVLVPSQVEEAWGRVVTEAQASGIPALASRIGGLAESVGPGGVLVDADAPAPVWIEALGAIWDDRERYESLSRAALDHAGRDEIRPQAITEAMLNILNKHSTYSLLT